MLKARGRPRNDQTDGNAGQAFRLIGKRVQVERSNGAPLWVQLKNGLEEAISSGALAARAPMPSENALCELFGVSRPVVRAAIGALAAEGRVIKMPRKGIFVAAPAEQVDFIASNLSVFGDLTGKGHTVTTKTFEFRRTAPDENEQKVFGISEKGSVVRIGRVYMSDGKPITMTHISLAGHKVPGLELLELENKSIFGTLREKYGISVHRSERWFTAEMPTPEQIEHMGIAPDKPLIAIESIAYDHDGTALEYYRAVYDSSFARIHVQADGSP